MTPCSRDLFQVPLGCSGDSVIGLLFRDALGILFWNALGILFWNDRDSVLDCSRDSALDCSRDSALECSRDSLQLVTSRAQVLLLRLVIAATASLQDRFCCH